MPVCCGATILQVVPIPLLRDDFAFAESIGLDNAWVVDQFWIDEVPQMPLLEAWTTLTALARKTERIRIGAMVTNVATRDPAVLARSILTVDQISGGRVEAAVGGGSYPAEHAAMGIEFLDGPGRGRHRRRPPLGRGLPARPHAVASTTLWIAAQATRSLCIAVRYADALVTLGEEGKGIEESLPVFRRRMEQVDELCATEGRDPAPLLRCLFAGWGNEPIFASLEATAAYVGRYVEAAATDFTCYLYDRAEPAFAELVAQHRMATANGSSGPSRTPSAGTGPEPVARLESSADDGPRPAGR